MVEVDGADFELAGVRLVFKLELLQHSGSFKARGAFTNLLTREVPPAGSRSGVRRQSRRRGGVRGNEAG